MLGTLGFRGFEMFGAQLLFLDYSLDFKQGFLLFLLIKITCNFDFVRFPDIPSNNKEYTFSWNPCNSYSEGNCVDVAVSPIFHTVMY